MGLGICVHNAHVVNTFSTILPEITDQEVTLMFPGLYWWHGRCDCCGFGPGLICLWSLHGTTCEDEEVVAHVRRGEIFSGQVRNPVTGLVVTHRDKADPLAVKGTANGESGVAAVTVVREVWRL